jgi:hypothetical protein
MGAAVHGRKAIRRVERETGEQIVHMASGWFTTVDHRHFGWDGAAWRPLIAQIQIGRYGSPCGLPVALSSCRWLFGEPEEGFTRGLMRGPCGTCGVGCSMLHRADCIKLLSLLAYVNPDYWPRPVHRPLWADDPRRGDRSIYELGFSMGLPPEMLLHGAHRDHYAAWEKEAGAARDTADAALAAVAPGVLRATGLDPTKYVVVYE